MNSKMKTLILFFLFLCAVFTSANAQITKGNWMIGGDVAFSYSKSKYETAPDASSFAFDLSPNVGYFVFDKIAGGIKVDYYNSKYTDDFGSSSFENFYLAPFVRYYFLEPEKPLNVFFEGAYRFSALKIINSNEISLKGGMAIFLNSSVAFEISITYLNLKYNNSLVGRTNTLLLGFGIQVHLEREK